MVANHSSQTPNSEPVYPSIVDLRASLPPVRDQGERATCVAFAVTAAHEYALLSDAASDNMSEEFLYWGCKQFDTDPLPGTTLEAADQALRRWGQPPAVYWPYHPQRDDMAAGYQPPLAALEPEVCRKAALTSIPATIEVIRQVFIRNRAAILVLPLSQPFFVPTDGLIHVPEAYEIINDKHAVLVVGYDERQGKYQDTLIIRNSWGSEWGIQGYAHLPYKYIRRYTSDCWILRTL